MASFDYIMASLKTAWDRDDLLPGGSIYYDRAEKPAQLAGFPYAEVTIELANWEVVTIPDATTKNSLVTYDLTVEIFTCQGQTGGSTSGDQMTDQGNLQRAFEAILNFIPPNEPWDGVEGFLHCLKGRSTIKKDEELYQGKDVLVSTNRWAMLVSE